MIVCPTCGKDNEDFFRFCLGCGTDLEEAAAPEEPAASEAEAPEPDRFAEEPAASEAEAPEPDRSAEEPADGDSGPPTVVEGHPPAALAAEAEVPEGTARLSPADMGITDTVDDLDPSVARSIRSSRPQTHRGTHRDAEAGDCPVCGAAEQAASAFCSNCGAPLPDVPAERTDGAPREPEAPRSGVQRGRLVLIREDGTDGPAYDLDVEGTIVGRESGHVNFPDDDFLADRHMELSWTDDALHVKPLPTTNGVFLRLFGEAEVDTGDSFRVGQQLLRFDRVEALQSGYRDVDDEGTLRLASPLPGDVWGRLTQQIGPDAPGNAYLCHGDDVYIGRERGDVTFPSDGYVSGSHAMVVRRGDRVVLEDLGSSNGTYLRLHEPRALERGDFLLVGQQLFRVEPG